MRFSWLPWLLALLCAPLCAQNAGIDRRFGDGGIASISDPLDPAAGMVGFVACTIAPDQVRVVAYFSGTLVGSIRVDARGRPLGTMERLTLPGASNSIHQIGACLGDGRIVIARSVAGSGQDSNLQVLRLRSDGSLDPTFGAGSGQVLVDMDNYATLDDAEIPLGLNLEADGGVLVSLRLALPGGHADPGLVRLAADGSLRFARHYPSLPGVTGVSAATAAGLAADGHIWLVGAGEQPAQNTWFRARLNAVSGLVVDGLGGSGSDGVITSSGRVLADGNTMVVAARYTQDGLRYLPRLLVFRGNTASQVDLPAPFDIAGTTASLPAYLTGGNAIPTGEGRILFTDPLTRMPELNREVATYLAVVELGASAAQDRVDTRFGINGRSQFAWRSGETCAGNVPPWQRLHHATNWRGRALLSGWHTSNCAGTQPYPMLVRVLNADDIFVDGLE